MIELSFTSTESWWIGFIVGVALTIIGTGVVFIIRDNFRYFVEDYVEKEVYRLFNEWKREEEKK